MICICSFVTFLPIMSVCFVHTSLSIMEFDATVIQVRGLASFKTIYIIKICFKSGI